MLGLTLAGVAWFPAGEPAVPGGRRAHQLADRPPARHIPGDGCPGRPLALGRVLDLAADLVRDLVDLLLGLDQAGLGPCRPLGGPALAPRRLPAAPRGVLRSPEQARDRSPFDRPVAARWQPEGLLPA